MLVEMSETHHTPAADSEPAGGRPVPARPAARGRNRLVFWAVAIIFGVPYLIHKAPQELACWYRATAELERLRENPTAALAATERAKDWDAHSWKVNRLSAQIKFEEGDYDGAVEECRRIIELHPELADGYNYLSDVLRKLKRHAEAIEQWNLIVTYVDTKERSIFWSRTGDRISLDNAYNGRAYNRALCGEKIAEGLADVRLAIRLLTSDEAGAQSDSAGTHDLTLASYLDTRGYLLYLNGEAQQGLADMERAISIVNSVSDQLINDRRNDALIGQLEQFRHQALGPMYYHRSLILGELGNEQAAAADLRESLKMGYLSGEYSWHGPS